MAKKNNSNSFNFSKLMGIIGEASKKTSIMIDNSNEEATFINTGIYTLNALLSKSIKSGGVPKSRITVFAGPQGVGKSYLCYNIARNAQKENYNIIYIDTEFSVERLQLPSFGIDVNNNFVLLRNNKVEDIKMFLTSLLEQLKQLKEKGEDVGKTIIFLDSIGQLASIKEIEDALEGKNKQDMSRAKAIKSLFRIISSDLGYLGIPLVCTNHVYMCLTEGHEVLKSDGSYEFIENLKIGDYIQTLDGDKEIVKTENFDNCPIIEILLENGQLLKCTPNHKFLIKPEWSHDENDECWISAENLKENDVILAIDEN
jgi:GTPase SAR1 family protein